jgi:hypothetical protein
MLIVFIPGFFNMYNNDVAYTITFDLMIMNHAFFTGYYLCDQIMTDKTHSMYGEEETCIQCFCGESWKKETTLEDLNIGWRKILKWILKK